MMNNKGVFLGIIALVGLALLAILFSLGINTYLVQAASQELRVKADIICNSLAEARSFNHSVLSKKFSQQVAAFRSESIGGSLKLTEATLVLPVYSDQGIGGSEYSLPNPNGLEKGVKVKFQLRGNSEDKLPLGIYNGDESVGNTYGCLLEGKVTQYSVSSSEPLIVTANSVTNRAVLGKFDNEKKKGLVIAVAPHMLSAGGSTFAPLQFPLPSPEPFSSQPNLELNSSIDPRSVDPSISPTPMPAQPSYPSTLTPAQRSELVNGCISPPILIRNMFVSAILKMASATGELRKSTALILMNRVITNKMINTAGNLPELPASTNIKDKLLSAGVVDEDGDDLLKPEGIPFPYTGYGVGDPLNVFNVSTTAQEYRQHSRNSLPAESPSPPAYTHEPDPLKFMQTNQLKNCLHLFKGESVTNLESGLDSDLNPDRFSSRLAEQNVENIFFNEPVNRVLKTSVSSVGSWSDLSDDDIYSTENEYRPILPAYNFPFLIGSIQRCPVSGLNYSYSDKSALCPKQSLGNPNGENNSPNLEEFRADMVGLFRRLSTPGDPYITGHESAPVLIVTHQSLTQKQVTEIQKLLFKTDVNGTLSNKIQDIWKNRRVVVVVIPSYGANILQPQGGLAPQLIRDEMQKYISPWIQALKLTASGPDAPKIKHRLFVFAPEIEENAQYFQPPPPPGVTPPPGSFKNIQEIYRDYWADLLDPNSENFVVNKAEAIFMSTFFLVDRKL